MIMKQMFSKEEVINGFDLSILCSHQTADTDLQYLIGNEVETSQ